MSDHAHIFDTDGHCSTCYEREDADPNLTVHLIPADPVEQKLAALTDHTVKALDVVYRSLRQVEEDAAADRLQKAEYWARMQELRSERDGNDAA